MGKIMISMLMICFVPSIIIGQIDDNTKKKKKLLSIDIDGKIQSPEECTAYVTKSAQIFLVNLDNWSEYNTNGLVELPFFINNMRLNFYFEGEKILVSNDKRFFKIDSIDNNYYTNEINLFDQGICDEIEFKDSIFSMTLCLSISTSISQEDLYATGNIFDQNFIEGDTCITTSFCCPSRSIEDFNNQGVNFVNNNGSYNTYVYPNPFNNQLKIISDDIIDRVFIFNSSFNRVNCNVELNGSNANIDFFTKVTPGIYYVKLINSNYVTVIKVVKS